MSLDSWVPEDDVFDLFPSNRHFLNKIVTYQELFCIETILASLTNHDSKGGNKKITKQQV